MQKWKLLNTYLPEAFPVYEAGVTTDFWGWIQKSTILCVCWGGGLLFDSVLFCFLNFFEELFL